MKSSIFLPVILSAFLFLCACSDKDTSVAPVATANPGSQTIVSGSSTSISLSSNVSGTTFSWTVAQSGVSGASAGSGNSIIQLLTLTGSATGTVTYTITPMADGTTGNAVTVTITVNPQSALVTYNTHIKPLLTTSCSPCHLPGGINPFKWNDYTTTKNKINDILIRVQLDPSSASFMPQGGSKLSAANIALLNKWVTDGLLEN